MVSRLPLGDLLRNLANDLKTFVRDELQLARQQMLEKVSRYGRKATILIGGGSAAYAGSIVLLAAIGLLVGYGFEGLGLDSLLAMFIGLSITGLAAIIVGAMLAVKGWKEFADVSPALTKAMQAASPKRGPIAGGTTWPDQSGAEQQPSTEQLQKQVSRTKERIGGETHELKNRALLRRMRQRTVEHVKAHPIAWGAAALGSIVLGGVVVGRKFLKS